MWESLNKSTKVQWTCYVCVVGLRGWGGGGVVHYTQKLWQPATTCIQCGLEGISIRVCLLCLTRSGETYKWLGVSNLSLRHHCDSSRDGGQEVEFTIWSKYITKPKRLVMCPHNSFLKPMWFKLFKICILCNLNL